MARSIQGAILDVDGTLVNSNDAHARAWVDTLAASDIQISFNEVRRLIGMGSDKLLPAIAHLDANSALGRRLAERRAELFRAR
jgi:beta-phosphoglucomutase-like phosphatase (HAD superfamily)